MINIKRNWIPRVRNSTEIQFYYISRKFDVVSPVFPPGEFINDVISFIKACPKDLSQLADAITFYEYSLRKLLMNPYNFSVIYDKNFIKLAPMIPQRVVKLFLIDCESGALNKIIDFLKENHSCVCFYYFINSKTQKPNLQNSVNHAHEFINLVIQNQVKILKYLFFSDKLISPSISLEYKELTRYKNFIPTLNNFHTFNNLIGNFCNIADEIKDTEELTEKSSESIKNFNSFTRQNLFLDQIKALDFYLMVGLKEKVFKLVFNTEPKVAPIILIAPFNNPGFEKYHSWSKTEEAKEYLNIFNTEQSENYVNGMKHNGNFETFKLSALLESYQLRYLDDVAFLHSTFTNSPIVRLPRKGKSIYKELSFFSTQFFSATSNVQSRRKLKKRIRKFSEIYKKVSISPELERLIKKRDGQIILITDLPLEWLVVENVPLAFTHDICRLPTTSLGGLMSIFKSNNIAQYTIPSNIIEKTLVIFGSDEPQFKIWQDICVNLSTTMGYKTERCNSISDIKQAITKHKPDFLIFDCHGSYNEELKSTVLWIGNDILTPEIIVKNQLTAPLIFLSACGTSPTYGIINSIANAFFESGSFAVTTTYLPVEINSSSILYQRVLRNLKYASETGIHKNWLEFIAHNIRSSFLMEKYLLIEKKTRLKGSEILMKKISSLLTEMLHFDNRRKIYFSMDEEISKLSGINKETFSFVVPEYLVYSNLGRADLAYFESWKDKFIELNSK